MVGRTGAPEAVIGGNWHLTVGIWQQGIGSRAPDLLELCHEHAWTIYLMISVLGVVCLAGMETRRPARAQSVE